MSPGSVTGMSPSYSEPSPDYTMLLNQQQRLSTPSSNSPPLNNTQNLVTHIGEFL